MQKIAIDIGYGDVKVKTENKEFKFPSAIEYVGSSIADFGEKTNNIYMYFGKEYKVGENVLKPISTRNFNFLIKYSPLLVYHAIKKAGLNTKEPIEISTGLSLTNWSEKEKFLKAIENIRIDEDVIKPQIFLFAQGEGIFNLYEGDKQGIVCVVDIGFNTLDFLTFENGVPEKKLSFATNQGVNVAITKLQSLMQKEFGNPISEQEAKKVFVEKGFRNFGEWIDLSDEIHNLKEDYVEFLIEELRARQLDTLRVADKVIFGGGGAYYIENVELPKNVILTEKPYEFANVRGYYGK